MGNQDRFECGVAYQLCRQHGRVCNRNDLIVIAVQNERRDVDFLEILSKIGLRERLEAVVMGLDSTHHSLQPPALADSLGNLCARTIEAVEGQQITPELQVQPFYVGQAALNRFAIDCSGPKQNGKSSLE